MCHIFHYKVKIRRRYPDQPIFGDESEDLSKLFGPAVKVGCKAEGKAECKFGCKAEGKAECKHECKDDCKS